MTRMTLWGLLALSACSGRLVEERALPLGADAADLTWTTTVPAGETCLWLNYELHAGTRRAGAGDGSEPVYDLVGSLQVRAGEAVVYQGPLELAEHAAPTTALGRRTVVGSHTFCGSDGCTTGGRVKILPLESVGMGAPLEITLHLPVKGGDFALQRASVQIRAK